MYNFFSFLIHYLLLMFWESQADNSLKLFEGKKILNSFYLVSLRSVKTLNSSNSTNFIKIGDKFCCCFFKDPNFTTSAQMSQSHVYLTADKYLAREHGTKMLLMILKPTSQILKHIFQLLIQLQVDLNILMHHNEKQANQIKNVWS